MGTMSWTRFARRFAPEPNDPLTVHTSFKTFIEKVNPGFVMYQHNRLLVEVLEATAQGEIPWLMVWMPPGTSKSEMFSRLYPAYVASMRPKHTVGVCSYGATLAQEMTRDAREYFAEFGGRLDPAQRAKTRWKTLEGGGMWGAGFGGAVRGFRYHMGVCDDPHKDEEDINSDLKRERLFRWWDTTWLNRAQLFCDFVIPRVIVQQRLADNDLCGHLLSRPDADKWTVVALDAVHDTETPLLPPNAVELGTRLWPDWREHGELLVPERLTEAKLKDQQADEESYLAQYQQRPRARTGKILDKSWFKICQEQDVPGLNRRCMGVDLAVSKKQSADYWAAFPGGVSRNGDIYIFRPWRDKAESPEARVQVARVARQRRVSTIGVEAVAFQLSFIHELRAMPEMFGFQVLPFDVDRDKEARARGWSHLPAQGRVWLVDDGSGWIDRFLDEIDRFPRGKHDDQVDAVGVLIQMIREVSSPGQVDALPHAPDSVYGQLSELDI